MTGDVLMAQDKPTIRLLTYRELIITLQRLCKEKRSGIMFINDGSLKSAKINLEKGVIIDVSFKEKQGQAALDLIKQIQKGKASFSSRLGESHLEKKIDLSTIEVFKFLISGLSTPQQKPTRTAPVKTTQSSRKIKAEAIDISNEIKTPATAKLQSTLYIDPNQVKSTAVPEKNYPTPSTNGAWGMSVIEALLSTFIGPVAKIICLNYVKDLGLAFDIKALNAVIDKISKQTLTPQQQKIFRHNILTFVNQYNLKSQESILNALKSSDKKLRLSPDSLALCVSKHNQQGKFGIVLLNKLTLQIERAGNLKETIGLIDILRLLEKTDKTGLLEVRSQNKRGGFYFSKGVLINAVESGMNGKIIAMDILQWQPDYIVFRAESQIGVTQQIRQTIDVLIQEVEKLHDIQLNKQPLAKISKANEIALIYEGTQLVEAHNNVQAEQIFTNVLMSYDDNFKGWFWLSRVLTNMTAIEIALKKAAHIHVKNADLGEDIKKFTLARKSIDSDFVLRCPFCWTPNAEQNTECIHCKSEFFITPSFFKTVGKAKFDILDHTIQRYNNALQEKQKNQQIYLRFYLAMAYLNRKYYQEGLDQLHEITQLAPENTALNTQHHILLDYMNAEGLTSSSIPQQTTTLNAQIIDLEENEKGRILIVEDSMVTRKVIARTLMANGYQIFEAKNAFEALDDLEEKNPNLILLDIILPGKDGYEILAEVRKKPMFAKLPVVMLTSRDSLFDKLKGKVSDANEYLTKPFQPDELLTVVRKYLR